MNKKISTRTAYGEALAEIGSDSRIFVLDAVRCIPSGPGT